MSPGRPALATVTRWTRRRPSSPAPTAGFRAIVSQPSFIYHYGDQYYQLVGPDRSEWLYRGRTLIDNGAVLVGSADRPLWGDPLRAIQTVVQRRTSSGRDQSPVERISVYEALQAFTVNAAWVARREDRLGRTTRGCLADFCLLDRNPRRIPVPEIADIEALTTVLDGVPNPAGGQSRTIAPV